MSESVKFYFFVFFFIAKIICAEKCFVTDHIAVGGFGNQILIFQHILKIIRVNYKDCIFLINGPKSIHIDRPFGKKMILSDFFIPRNFSSCKNSIHENHRKHLCEYYNAVLKKSKYNFNISLIPNARLKIISSSSKNLCHPFYSKSPILGQLLCNSKRDQNLPFFFELFEFKRLIRIIGEKFIIQSGMKQEFAALHFRGGDFKGRKLPNAYHSFEKCLNYSLNIFSKIPSIKSIFIMAEKMEEIYPLPIGCVTLSDEWIESALKPISELYSDSIKFIKLLIEIYICSKGIFFVGNAYSTLTELIIDYGQIKNQNFLYGFVK